MEIQQRGTPPYVVWSAGVLGCPEGHGSSLPTYRDAIAGIYDLTAGGVLGVGGGDLQPARVVDSKNRTVFSMNNPEDVALFETIKRSGVVYLRVAEES